MPKRVTLASVIVERSGWGALWPCMDLLVLWAAATQGGRRSLPALKVAQFGEASHWGSQAKFYRLLRQWKEATGTKSPAVVLGRVRLSSDRIVAMGQAFAIDATVAGVA